MTTPFQTKTLHDVLTHLEKAASGSKYSASDFSEAIATTRMAILTTAASEAVIIETTSDVSLQSPSDVWHRFSGLFCNSRNPLGGALAREVNTLTYKAWTELK